MCFKRWIKRSFFCVFFIIKFANSTYVHLVFRISSQLLAQGFFSVSKITTNKWIDYCSIGVCIKNELSAHTNFKPMNVMEEQQK